MADDKKLRVRAAFQEFVEERLKLSLEKISNAKLQSHALARFYVEELHNPLRSPISEDDFEDAYVDAKGDLGVDLLHRDDGMVYVIQVKYAKPGAETQAEVVEHFRNVLVRLRDQRLKQNSRLADALIDVNFDTDQFVCRFITLGRINGQARVIAESPAIQLDGIPDFEDRVAFEFLDEEDLNVELRTARATRAVPDTSCSLFSFGPRAKRSAIIELVDGQHRSFVMVVSASQLVNVYSQYKESLFNLNIRNYISDTPINKSIKTTAVEKPSEFFHLNNGISCVATSVNVDGELGSLKAEGFQVINGAQSLRSLHKASGSKWKNGEPLVLLRVTEIGKGYGEAKRFRDDIIRANNTQNVIKVSDFRSNDPIQTDLQAKFAEYHRAGRAVVYVPKRTDQIPRQTEVIRLEEFAKAVYSFLCDPVSFSGSTTFLFDASEKGGYRHIFGNGQEVWDAMPTEEFRLRSAVWWLALTFGERIKQDRAETADPIKKASLERKWWAIHAARIALQHEFGDSYRHSLAAHYKGGWQLGEGEVGQFFEALYVRSQASVLFAYKESAKRDGFVHRNWMRNHKTVDAVREAVETVSTVAAKLPKFPR